jgi:lipopolysaccharide transport system ATP-binding protein
MLLSQENNAESEDRETILTARNVSKKFAKSLRSSLRYGVTDIAREFSIRGDKNDSADLRKDEFWALQDISFDLKRGDSIAIIGENGSGKSTLLKVLYGLVRPDRGSVTVNGSVGAIIELGAGLNPNFTGRENIYLQAALLGIPSEKADLFFDEIIEFSELQEFIDSPVLFYSSGMVSRLAFSVMAIMKPSILLIDEVLAVGDMHFQRKCVNLMVKYLSFGGAIIFVSHSTYQIQSVCKRAILIDKGQAVFSGTAIEALDVYANRQSAKDAHVQNTKAIKRVSPNEPVIIDEVSIKSRSEEKIQFGREAEITVRYTSLQAIRNVTWAFDIWTSDNTTCITGNRELPEISLVEGNGQLRCNLPNLPLLAGTYLLKVSIIEPSSFQALATHGWANTPTRFDVLDDASQLMNLRKNNGQLTAMLDVEWT